MGEDFLGELAEGARIAMRGVVQIQAYGFDEDNAPSVLDPRFASMRSWGGSGFLIGVEQRGGLILTNAHVVRNATNLQVMSLLTSERTFAAEVVGIAARQEPDVALIKLVDDELEEFIRLCGGSAPYVELADSDAARRGWHIKAIGYPFGMAEPNISGGELSNFVAGDEVTVERLVTDAAINPGNSGGPAITRGGLALGLNTAIVVNADNIGFITPINYAKLLLPQLLSSREARVAEVGARFQPNSPTNAEYLRQSDVDGVIVTRVRPEGMFASAGIEPLDVIRQIDEHHVDRYGIVKGQQGNRKRNLYDVVRQIPVGQPVKVCGVRKGRPFELVAEATPAPNHGIDTQPYVAQRRYVLLQGMILQELCYEIISAISSQISGNYWAEIDDRYGESSKIVASFVIPGSPADDMFFGMGAIITKINGRHVRAMDQVVDAIRTPLDGRHHLVFVETRQGQFGVFQLSAQERAELRVQSVGEQIGS
ncbi:MAG: trypsin-like peptidase domain-containing protein [Proteobacteria bacterium]|nr:trypsin-like peptidase domain-containing protein [Pseudomonadota bacterium]